MIKKLISSLNQRNSWLMASVCLMACSTNSFSQTVYTDPSAFASAVGGAPIYTLPLVAPASGVMQNVSAPYTVGSATYTGANSITLWNDGGFGSGVYYLAAMPGANSNTLTIGVGGSYTAVMTKFGYYGGGGGSFTVRVNGGAAQQVNLTTPTGGLYETFLGIKSGSVITSIVLANISANANLEMDLLYPSGGISIQPAGPNAANTTLAMVANQNAVRSLLNQRSSAIMTMMDYDCETFDAKGFCVSFRARYTAMDSQSEGAGVFTAAYRASEKVRIGGFVDYRASEKDSAGLKQGDTMPTVGAFAAYSHTGDATGFQAKASAAYNSGKVTVTRDNSLANTEAGSGKTGLNSYAIGAELAWGFAVSPTMLATPYAGIRYSDATRKSYTEGTVTGTVDFPITYDAYYQRLTTATTGVRVTGMFSDKVGYQASLGGEYDLAHKSNTYSGTSTITGLENFALANTGSSNRARVVASAGLHYQMDKTQRLTATVNVRGQAYSSQPSVTTLVGYQVAF